MQLDNEQQREVILAAINAANVKGSAIEIVYAVKLAVQEARLSEPVKEPESD